MSGRKRPSEHVVEDIAFLLRMDTPKATATEIGWRLGCSVDAIWRAVRRVEEKAETAAYAVLLGGCLGPLEREDAAILEATLAEVSWVRSRLSENQAEVSYIPLSKPAWRRKKVAS